MIEQAIADEVTESQNIDFKRDLPLPDRLDREAKQQKQGELAKDIAAMANADGGLILYGVEEKAGPGSAAGAVRTIGARTEIVEKQIRQVAGSLIQPPVRELRFDWLASEPADDGVDPLMVLALSVPSSPDQPHLIHPHKGQGDWFAVPYRNGPDTHLMTDLQLQAAYAERERGQRRVERDFNERFEELLNKLPGEGWVTVMAAPERPFKRTEGFEIYTASDVFKVGLSDPRNDLSPALLLRGADTRVGLRRFTRRRSVLGSDGEFEIQAYAEVHSDGAVAVAFSRGGYYPPFEARPRAIGPGVQQPTNVPGSGRTHIAIADIKDTISDFERLLWSMRQAFQVSGPYRARLWVPPPTTHVRRDRPRKPHEFQPADDERDAVHGFRAIDARLTDDRGDESVLESVVEILADALAQAGVEEIYPTDVEGLIVGFEYARGKYEAHRDAYLDSLPTVRALSAVR